MPMMTRMMPMMMVMPRASRVLHAVADHRADGRSRRSEDGAGGRADGRAAQSAVVFRPVVAECARGRQQQRRAEHGCRNALMNQGCHRVDLLR